MKSKRCSHNLQSDQQGSCQRIWIMIMRITSKTNGFEKEQHGELQSLEYATYSCDKNRRRTELSSSVLLQISDKLRSLQGTELSVLVVVICLLGSFWILTLNSRCWLIVINEVKCYEVWMFIQVWYVQLQALIYKALLNILTSDKFHTFSSNFYQHHNFHNLLISSPGKNDVN